MIVGSCKLENLQSGVNACLKAERLAYGNPFILKAFQLIKCGFPIVQRSLICEIK